MTRHTDNEIEQAAERFERLAETLDPETARVEETNDLRAVATDSYRGRIRLVASQKRSISFDESILHEAEERLTESGGSLSAFVNAAVLRELRVARGLDLLAEDDAQFGSVPAGVRTQVAAEWPA